MSGDGEPRLRIRRLEDERRLLGRHARYELEWEAAGATRSEVTTTPSTVLREVLGLSHPADVSRWTEAATQAWDGGTGQWREGPEFDAPQVTAAPLPDQEDPEVQRRAERMVEERVGESLPAGLTLLASMLAQVGHYDLAGTFADIGQELLLPLEPSRRAQLHAEVQRVWEDKQVYYLRPTTGSALEWAVAERLITHVPRLLGEAERR